MLDAKKLLILHLAIFPHTGSDVYEVTDLKNPFFPENSNKHSAKQFIIEVPQLQLYCFFLSKCSDIVKGLAPF